MSRAPISVGCHPHLYFIITLQYGSLFLFYNWENWGSETFRTFPRSWSLVGNRVLCVSNSAASLICLCFWPLQWEHSLIFCAMIFRKGAVTVCVSPFVGVSKCDRDERGTLLSKPHPCLVLKLGGSSWNTKESSRSSSFSVGSVLCLFISMGQQNPHLPQPIFYPWYLLLTICLPLSTIKRVEIKIWVVHQEELPNSVALEHTHEEFKEASVSPFPGEL